MSDRPTSEPDSIVEAELLDELLKAIQTGDVEVQQQLIQQHPQLQEWSSCFSDLDKLAHLEEVGTRVDSATILYSPQPAISSSVVQETTQLLPPSDSHRFGRYELLEEVGRGGMGVVFKALQVDLNRTVALKMILASERAGADEIQRFQTEAHAVARLQHRNIISIHEVGKEQGRHYFAMNYVEGKNLAEIVSAGSQSPEQAARWMFSIAQAVQHLHEHGILHRDLKPSNIIIDSEGEPIVTDFGLAKLFDTDTQATRSGTILGTPSYMSPEQASGQHSQIKEWSDVYSLGAMLYELLSGRPPFKESNPLDTLVQVLEGEPSSLRSRDPEIPRNLEFVCFKCLEKDPARRYSSAAELAADLQRFLKGEPVEAQGGGLVQKLERWVRRQPGLACHLGAMLSAGIILQVHYWLSDVSFAFHLKIMLIIAVWAASSVFWQSLLNRDRMPNAARIGTSLGDITFLTLALILSEGPPGMLLVLHPLLIVGAGLWFRTPLVWITTVGVELSLVTLVLLQPTLRNPWHFPMLVATTYLVLGASVSYQVNRVRSLSRFYERRPLP